MVAWILLAVVTVTAGAITLVRMARVRKLSQVTIADPERVGEELLAYVARQGPRVVALRPVWNTRPLSYADRWAVQGPLHLSGRLLPADEARSFLGYLRNYMFAPLSEYVVLPR